VDLGEVICSGALSAQGCAPSLAPIVATVDVLTSSPTLFIQSFLRVFAYNCDMVYTDCAPDLNGTADAGHTAQLSIQLPAGFGYQSDSGVFLTEVPQPGDGTLLALGLFALATPLRGSRRRR